MIRKTEVPRVERDGDCSNLCIFKDYTNKWCYESSPPMIQLGWEWKQLYAQTPDTVPLRFYQLKFRPYAIGQAYIKQELDIKNLFYNLLIFDLAKFKYTPFFLATVTGDGYFCYGMGTENDLMKLQVLMSNRLMDCSKTLLKDLCNFSESWTGYNAKWLENCGQGYDAEIRLWMYTLVKRTENKVFWGTANPRSKTNCHLVIPRFQKWFKTTPTTTTATTTTTTAAEVDPQNMLALMAHNLWSNVFEYLATMAQNEQEESPDNY